jgi:hypothetical protein
MAVWKTRAYACLKKAEKAIDKLFSDIRWEIRKHFKKAPLTIVL